MSSNDKDTKKDLDAKKKPKFSEELEKRPISDKKNRTPEEIAVLQQQYEDAKKEKLKREMALQKYENDFLSAKVPKEKIQELAQLNKMIVNEEGAEDLEVEKKQNIAKKIALEKEIAQIMEQHRPLLYKELENKDSEFTKGYAKFIAALDEQSKKVNEARLKFEGIDERPPLKNKKSPQNPVEAYDTGSPHFLDNKDQGKLKKPTNDVKSDVKDLDLSNVERFLKEQYKDNKYKLNPTSQQLEITLKNKSTITLEKNKVSTESDREEDKLLMIQMYLQALVKEGKDLSKITLTAKGKDTESTEWLQIKANEMKNRFIEQHKKDQLKLTEPKDKLELGHTEVPDTSTQPNSSTESRDQTQDFGRQRSRSF